MPIDFAEALVTRIPPLKGSRVVRSWPLEGGISASMTAFELVQPDGARRRVVVRRPGSNGPCQNPTAAQTEYEVLRTVKSAGLPVPGAYGTSDEPEPFLAIEYIEGAPEVAPSDVEDFLQRYAAQLAQIHRVDLSALKSVPFPPQTHGYDERPARLNESLREGEIRDALETIGPIRQSNPPVLCHGDLWPGNVLWRNREIAAVIDWEECHIGEPLADLAICRLDLWWILGKPAADRLTELYQAQRNLDLTDLPYWDLRASLRPITNIEEWAPTYPKLGRPDITESTLRRDHQAFVHQALEAL